MLQSRRRHRRRLLPSRLQPRPRAPSFRPSHLGFLRQLRRNLPCRRARLRRPSAFRSRVWGANPRMRLRLARPRRRRQRRSPLLSRDCRRLNSLPTSLPQFPLLRLPNLKRTAEPIGIRPCPGRPRWWPRQIRRLPRRSARSLVRSRLKLSHLSQYTPKARPPTVDRRRLRTETGSRHLRFGRRRRRRFHPPGPL
jgi:hypothetical protein